MVGNGRINPLVWSGKLEISSLNSHSSVFHCGTKYRCISTLLKLRQRSSPNSTQLVRQYDHYRERFLGTVDRPDFDLFDVLWCCDATCSALLLLV